MGIREFAGIKSSSNQFQVDKISSSGDYKKYLDIAGVMIVALDINQKVTLINKKGCEVLGYPENEIAGKNWFDHFIHSDDIERVKEVFNKIISGDIEPVEYYENPVVTRDMELRLIAWHNSITYDDEGNINGLLSSGEDITEQKKLEKALLESKNQLKLIMDSLPVLIANVDSDRRYRFVNKAYSDWFGYQPSEVFGKHVRDVLGDEAYKSIEKYIGQALSGEEVRFKGIIPYLDGGERYFNAIYNPDFDEMGKVKGFFALVMDITEIRKAEEKNRIALQKIHDQSTFLENTIESIRSPFYVIETNDYSVTLANSSAFPDIEWKNKPCYQLTHNRDTPCNTKEHSCPMEIVREIKQVVRVEHIHEINGEKRFFEIYGYPILDDSGNVKQMIEYSIDITDRKKTEKRIREAYAELKNVDQMKTDIISNISHELRTPLSIIKASMELISEEEDPKEIFNIISVAQKAVLRQNDIIENLIAASRIHRKNKNIMSSKTDLNDLIQSILDYNEEKIINKSVEISFKPDCNIPPIRGDRKDICLAFKNLLDNSIKFNEHGGEISINLIHNSDKKTVTVKLADTGIGIKKEDIGKIFKPLTQLDPSISRQFEGTGMGLSVANKIIDFYGGSISIESEVGKGTSFYVTLPI